MDFKDENQMSRKTERKTENKEQKPVNSEK
jgi:hypothetical protein